MSQNIFVDTFNCCQRVFIQTVTGWHRGRALFAGTVEAVVVFGPVMPKWELTVLVFAVCENFTPSKVGKHI
jgi:hypothetical protein